MRQNPSQSLISWLPFSADLADAVAWSAAEASGEQVKVAKASRKGGMEKYDPVESRPNLGIRRNGWTDIR
jgi:hypothetical protein